MRKSIIVLLLSVLLVGCVQLTKDITITYVSGDGTYKCNTWTVSAYPNETKTITLRISNTAKTSSIVKVAIVGGMPTLTGSGNYTVPAKGYKDIKFVWSVNPSVVPNSYRGYITISTDITCKHE